MTSPCTHLPTELTPAQQGNVSFLGHSGNEVVSLCLTPTYREKNPPTEFINPQEPVLSHLPLGVVS